MAIYDFDRPLIMDAVESAWERGIELRVVADEDEADDEGFEFLEELGVPVVYRPSGSRIMHNKFVVLDAQVVWTGSTNLTDTGLERNNNHTVSIAHSELAAAYTMNLSKCTSMRRLVVPKTMFSRPMSFQWRVRMLNCISHLKTTPIRS